MPHSVEMQTINTLQNHGDWRDDLFRDGFVVVKGVVPPKKSQRYVDQMFSWLETFPYGFERSDPQKWTPEYLPTHIKGGMYHAHSIQHERFMWEARQEPKVIEAFAKLWGTDKLLVSFDGMNLTLPVASRTRTEPWPHVDQSPNRIGLQCVQGFLNFAPNGPKDGGLVVMKGSHKFNEKFFKTHKVLGRKTWGPEDWFGFEQSEVAWFEERGCELTKVCAEPGDLVLWDSRTVHYNILPESMNVRALIYLCYTPASFATAEDLRHKGDLFDRRMGTTHWPHANIFANEGEKTRLGKPDLLKRRRPIKEPEENERSLKLAGRLSY